LFDDQPLSGETVHPPIEVIARKYKDSDIDIRDQ